MALPVVCVSGSLMLVQCRRPIYPVCMYVCVLVERGENQHECVSVRKSVRGYNTMCI